MPRPDDMRSPNVILAGLCAGALATGGLLWLWSGPTSGPPSGTPIADRAAATEPGEVRPATANDPAPSRDPQARTELTAEATAEGRPRGGDRAAAAPGPVVLVLGGKPPRPMPGIEVAWIDRGRGYELRKSLREAERIHTTEVDLPHRFGERAMTDAQGRVQLPPIDSRHIVAATDATKELFGASTLRPGNKELKITLEPDEELRIVVRGFDDRPRAGVPVAVHQGSGYSKARDIWKGKTDAQGLAIVRHFQRERRTGRAQKYGGRMGTAPALSSQQQEAPEERRYAAVIALPLATPAVAEFDGEPAPADPVELRLPPMQPLTATVVHESGAKLISKAQAYLYALRGDDDVIEEPLERNFDRLRVSKPLGEEPIEFGPVGLSTEMQPLLRFPGQRSGQRLARFTSSADDQPQHITLEIPEEFSVIAGRAVLADEQPLADAEILYAITTPQGTLAQSEAQCLEDGRFDFVCKPRGDPRPHRLQLRWTDAEGVLHGAERTLGVLEAGEHRDLSDLVLTPLPPLARGRVVDDRGLPVPAARLSIQYRVETSRGERWVSLPRVGARPDDEGRYEVFGSAPPQAIRVVARARGHFDFHSEPIAAGATVNVPMQRHGQLSGRILLPAWLPRGAASVQLRNLSTSKEGRATSVRNRNGDYQVREIRPGNYDLAIRLRNLPKPLAVIENLLIQSGQNDLPEALIIDLRDALYRYRLRVLGDREQLLTELDGPILWRNAQPDGTTHHVAFRWRKGQAEIITPEPLLELTALSPGYQPTEVSVGPGDHDIRLPRLHPVIIDVPGLRGCAGTTRAIRISMILTGESGLPQSLRGVDQQTGRSYSFQRYDLAKSGGGWLDPFDRAHAELCRNGTYDVVIRLNLSASQRSPQVSIPVGQLEVVLDGPAPQRHQLSFDAAEVQQKLHEFQERMQAMKLHESQAQSWTRTGRQRR